MKFFLIYFVCNLQKWLSSSSRQNVCNAHRCVAGEAHEACEPHEAREAREACAVRIPRGARGARESRKVRADKWHAQHERITMRA